MSVRWKTIDAPDLPDGLILFDGVCILCSWWVRFIIERDKAMRFRFVPIQSPYGEKLATRFGISLDKPETNAIVTRGKAWFKSDAALEVLAGLPGYSWTRPFAFLPRFLRNWLYDRVARNRYKLFGRTETCMVPTPDVQRRFLT